MAAERPAKKRKADKAADDVEVVPSGLALGVVAGAQQLAAARAVSAASAGCAAAAAKLRERSPRPPPHKLAHA
jgi:hypothetical protein